AVGPPRQAADRASPASATSHVPAAAPHSVPEGSLASAGQLAPEPVQLSATSQAPADGRQTTVLGTNASVGQVVLNPVHISATSHGPAEARQTAPALPAACWQASVVPLH